MRVPLEHEGQGGQGRASSEGLGNLGFRVLGYKSLGFRVEKYKSCGFMVEKFRV